MQTPKALFFIAAAALCATACTKRPAQPQFGMIAIDTLLGNQAAGCRVEYRFATIGNAAQSPALQAIEQANICYFFELEAFPGSALEATAVNLRQLSEELGISGLPQAPAGTPAGMGLGEISIESEAEIIDTLLNYTITRSSFTGGAHGMYGTEYHTYSLPGGYEVTLADLFDDKQTGKLNALIRTKLYEQYEVRDDEGLVEKGFFPEYIGVTENFHITPEGLTFCYNPYEIGCYALGDVVVTISREELHSL